MVEPFLSAGNAAGHGSGEADYPLAGETLGLWRLVRGIGRGGMGEVYEAEYDYLYLLSLRYSPEQRDVIKQELHALSRSEQARLAGEMLGTPLPPDARFAIKVCNARSGTAGHKRFLQEAEMAQRLGDHPYIVTVHAVNAGGGLEAAPAVARFDLERGKYKDVAFMVMDLSARDYDHTKLSIAESVHIVRCIATALDHAHSAGIIHRDLKPENILGGTAHPLLTDFGIAKELDQSHGLTRTGQIIGTLDYMSPEQATDAKRVDHRSDIYSLGVVLYEMTTQGSLPYFHKMDRESCLAAIRSERVEPKWPREYVKKFPVGLERIILKAMAHNMEDRYQAMSEFITDLDRFTRGEWLPFFGRVKVSRWVRHQIRRHPKLVWGGGSGLAATALLLLALWFMRWSDDNRRGLDSQLKYLEQVVTRIEARKECQLSKDDKRKIEDLDGKLKYFGADKYPEQRLRRQQLESRLLRSRWLEARFVGRTRDGSRPLTGEECIAAMEQFQLAATAETSLWNLLRDGLVMQERAPLTLGPYGDGVVYCLLQLKTCDGFQLRIREKDDPRHLTAWRINDGVLQLSQREDERPPEILGSVPLGPERFHTLKLALEVRPDGIRSWWPEPRSHPDRHGLVAGAPAVIELDLPKDTVLMQIEVWPEGPN